MELCWEHKRIYDPHGEEILFQLFKMVGTRLSVRNIDGDMSPASPAKMRPMVNKFGKWVNIMYHYLSVLRFFL